MLGVADHIICVNLPLDCRWCSLRTVGLGRSRRFIPMPTADHRIGFFFLFCATRLNINSEDQAKIANLPFKVLVVLPYPDAAIVALFVYPFIRYVAGGIGISAHESAAQTSIAGGSRTVR